MYQYMRALQPREDERPDGLEQICNKLAVDGWRIIAIDTGSQFRTATLEREVPKGKK